FGTFQRHAFFDRADRISALIDYVIAWYYPELAGAENKAAALLEAVSARMATTVAAWMAAGFVHGVLNTDNMNITGESFDYGPYRFLPKNDPAFTAAYFDHAGLYAFGRQPESVFWNLQQLAGCLTLASDPAPLVEVLNTFGEAYSRALAEAMRRRLGVASLGAEADAELAGAAFRALAEGGERLRWEPFFFDWFCGDAERAKAGVRGDLYAGEAFQTFAGLLARHAPERPERLAADYFRGPEPQELIYEEIEAIWADIAERDDWSAFEAKLAGIEAARAAYAF